MFYESKQSEKQNMDTTNEVDVLTKPIFSLSVQMYNLHAYLRYVYEFWIRPNPDHHPHLHCAWITIMMFDL